MCSTHSRVDQKHCSNSVGSLLLLEGFFMRFTLNSLLTSQSLISMNRSFASMSVKTT